MRNMRDERYTTIYKEDSLAPMLASSTTSGHIRLFYYSVAKSSTCTYDHRRVRTGHPVRSAILKHQIGRSVVGWVTTSESLLLYVSFILLFCPHRSPLMEY